MLLWTQVVSFSLWSNNNVPSLKLFFTQIQIWLNCFVMKSMTRMFSLVFSYGNKWLHCTLTIGRCPTHSASSRLVTELPVSPERVLLPLPDLGFLFGSVFFLEVMKMPWLSSFLLEEVISSTQVIALKECESYFVGLARVLFKITHLVNSFHYFSDNSSCNSIFFQRTWRGLLLCWRLIFLFREETLLLLLLNFRDLKKSFAPLKCCGSVILCILKHVE